MTGRALSPALSPKRQTIIAHLLGKASSDHDAEVASALRKADEIVRAHGLSWHDIVAVPEPSARVQKPKRQPSQRAKKTNRPNQPDMGASCPSWRDASEQILAAGCTAWERKFCCGLLDNWRALTPKQAACLARIYRVRAAGFAERRRRA
jgi:hypothetical protein